MNDQHYKELKKVQAAPINKRAKMFLDKSEPGDEMMYPAVLYLLQKHEPTISKYLPKLTTGAIYYAILDEIQRLRPKNVMIYLGLTQPYDEDVKEAMRAKTELEMAEILMQYIYEELESRS